jgi:hypothetical protein
MSQSQNQPQSTRNILWFVGISAIIIALLAVILFATHPSRALTISLPSGTSSAAVSVEGGKTGVVGMYPDPMLTPGHIYTNITEKDVCEPGYSGRVRNVPEIEKKQVYARYHTERPTNPSSYEVDHFISLQLGGNNDVENLWPEPEEPRPGFREKDKVENYLHRLVCDGTISLKTAQDRIQSDWYAVYLEMKN